MEKKPPSETSDGIDRRDPVPRFVEHTEAAGEVSVVDRMVYELENSERAEDGGDPEIKFYSDDLTNDTKLRIGHYRTQSFRDAQAKANEQQGSCKGVPNAQSPEGPQYLEPGEIPQFSSQTGMFDWRATPGIDPSTDSDLARSTTTLLGDLRGTGEKTAEDISNILNANSKTTPDNYHIPNGAEDEDEAGTGTHRIQYKLGEYSGKSYPLISEPEGVISVKQLRSIGLRVLLEATGEHYIPRDTEEPAQLLGAHAASIAAPGLARLGIRIPTDRFSAASTLSAINDNVSTKSSLTLKSDGQISYGSVNNPFIPFDSISSNASAAITGTLLTLVFSEMFIMLAAILEKERPSREIDWETNRRYLLGSRWPNKIPKSENAGLEFLETVLNIDDFEQGFLLDTDHDYHEAVSNGVSIFFGISNEASSILNSATKLAETPGYYNTILRSLVRSITDPIHSLIGIFAGPVNQVTGGSVGTRSALDISPVTGPPGDPVNWLEAIKVLKESKFVKFMNVMAAIGDSGIVVSELDEDDATDEVGMTGLRIKPRAVIQRSRLSENVNAGRKHKLAWSTSTTPTLVNLAPGFRKAMEQANGENEYRELSSILRPRIESSRISDGDRIQIERELNAYYMPFYFHDLRTNEFVSFHAFLSTVSDNHQAQYSESAAYGRIGYILTHKNTTRQISVSFMVVATDPDDFDMMYFKLNRLVMMLYPQYTVGRKLSTGSETFTQPFSQLPGASPMIRLRVGDIIKSNYSEFDLKRLFGIGDSNFNLDTNTPSENQLQAANMQNITTVINEIRERISENEFYVGDEVELLTPVDPAPRRRARRGNRQTSGDNPSGLTIERDPTNTNVIDGIGNTSLTSRERRNDRQNAVPTFPRGSKFKMLAKIADKVWKAQHLDGGGETYKLNFTSAQNNCVRATSNHLRSQYGLTNSVSTQNATNTTDAAAHNTRFGEFFDAENNPIVKSFDTVRGEGLAGFITSISFDWLEGTWETEGLNNRAPKYCTIQVDFSPVYDINPGLDANGSMIGTIYNVGNIMEKYRLHRQQTEGNPDADYLPPDRSIP